MARFKVYENDLDAPAPLRLVARRPVQQAASQLTAARGVLLGVAVGAAAWGFAALLYLSF